MFAWSNGKTLELTFSNSLIIHEPISQSGESIWTCARTLKPGKGRANRNPRDFHCPLVFVTPGKTLALVYEILLDTIYQTCSDLEKRRERKGKEKEGKGKTKGKGGKGKGGKGKGGKGKNGMEMGGLG